MPTLLAEKGADYWFELPISLETLLVANRTDAGAVCYALTTSMDCTSRLSCDIECGDLARDVARQLAGDSRFHELLDLTRSRASNEHH